MNYWNFHCLRCAFLVFSAIKLVRLPFPPSWKSEIGQRNGKFSNRRGYSGKVPNSVSPFLFYSFAINLFVSPI
jgi:hypothetical protein